MSTQQNQDIRLCKKCNSYERYMGFYTTHSYTELLHILQYLSFKLAKEGYTH